MTKDKMIKNDDDTINLLVSAEDFQVLLAEFDRPGEANPLLRKTMQMTSPWEKKSPA